MGNKALARKQCIEEVFLNSCRTLNMKKVKACIDLDVDVNCTHDMRSFDYCVSEDKIRNFALKYAVEQNSEELCDLLLQHPDINVDNRDEDGRNVLMTACKIGKKKMLWILLQGMHD